MHVFFGIKEKRQGDHQQKRAAKGANRNPRIGHDPGIFLRFGRRQTNGFERADICGNGDNSHRKHNPHAKHSDENAPCQEPALPNWRHVL